MKLQAGDYIDLRGMSLKQKTEVGEYLSKNNVFWSGGQVCDKDNFILFDSSDNTLLKLSKLQSNSSHKTKNRTSELLHKMSLSSEKSQEITGNILDAAKLVVCYLVANKRLPEGGKLSADIILRHWDKARGNDSFGNYVRKDVLSSSKIAENATKLPEKFKVRNANRPEVREWLAENVTDRLGTGHLTLSDRVSDFLFFNENNENTFTRSNDSSIFKDHSMPELILHTGVISYEIKDSKKDRLEERKKELERELLELNKELSNV